MSRSHHFRGIVQYAEQLMDIAEGRPAFTGRGQTPWNKEVSAAIASIKKCRQGSFFKPSANKPCSCGWHTKAAARKKARQAQSDASASSLPRSTTSSSTTASTSSTTSSTDQPQVGAGPVPPKFDRSESRARQAQSDASASSLPTRSNTSSSTAASTSSTTSSTDQPQVGAGPVPPKFDRSDFQSPTISELRAIGIGTKTSPGKLDLLVYCPLMGRCPHCKSALITANSVG